MFQIFCLLAALLYSTGAFAIVLHRSKPAKAQSVFTGLHQDYKLFILHLSTTIGGEKLMMLRLGTTRSRPPDKFIRVKPASLSDDRTKDLQITILVGMVRKRICESRNATFYSDKKNPRGTHYCKE